MQGDAPQVRAVPSQVDEPLVLQVEAALGVEGLQLVAALRQGLDTVPGHQLAPADVQVHQAGAALRQVVQGVVGDQGAAAQVQVLEKRKGTRGRFQGESQKFR